MVVFNRRQLLGRVNLGRIACAILFLLLLAFSFRLDQPVAEFLARPIRSGQLKAVLRAMRCWGEGATLAVVSLGIISVKPRRWREPLAALVVAFMCAGVVDLVKPLIGRDRPIETITETGEPPARSAGNWNSSFPSGHTATAFAFARGLSLAYPALQPICLLAATGTAVSRMYDQRHFLSDCVAGALLGWYLAGWLLPWMPASREFIANTANRTMDNS